MDYNIKISLSISQDKTSWLHLFQNILGFHQNFNSRVLMLFFYYMLNIILDIVTLPVINNKN